MKSGLLDDLMNFLRELMKDYKHDVNEMLASDKQLATEINYDLKKWEEEQAEVRRQQEEERVRNFDFQTNSRPWDYHWNGLKNFAAL